MPGIPVLIKKKKKSIIISGFTLVQQSQISQLNEAKQLNLYAKYFKWT